MKKHWALISSIFLFCIIIAIIFVLSIQKTNGHLVYALDDSYIHMAIAKNFSQYASWGVNRNSFSSSTSSPIWTFLLSIIYLIFGVNDISPFILNIIFSILAIMAFYFILKTYTSRNLLIFIVLIGIMFFTPFLSLVFGGLEHTLQILLDIIFIYFSVRILSTEKYSSSELILPLILAPLVILVRYEGLFLVFTVFILLFIKKKYKYSIYMSLSGILPISTYGLISIIHGWYFLPNSVLMKGNRPHLSNISSIINTFGGTCLKQMTKNIHILVLIISALFILIILYNENKYIWKKDKLYIIIFIVVTLLHLQFAKTGWFFRYEAYLVPLGLFSIFIGIYKYIPQKIKLKNIKIDLIPLYIFILILTIIIIYPLAKRGLHATREIPDATKNIYEQQYQMGLFLKKYYNNSIVAANDIGAINYLSDIECLDLIGLGDMDIAELRRKKLLNTESLYKLAKEKNVKIAILYKNWFEVFGGFPKEWIEVGEWGIPKKVVCGDTLVSFFAVDKLEKYTLINNLKDFSRYLPKDVYQSGIYTQ